MNRWHIYEFMKQSYMRTGIIPTTATIVNLFREAGREEISEGIYEFVALVDQGRFRN